MEEVRNFFLTGCRCCLVMLVSAVTPVWVAAGSNDSWQPVASEKLVKLPAHYLKKRLHYDFSGSELGKALNAAKTKVIEKGKTLNDLRV